MAIGYEQQAIDAAIRAIQQQHGREVVYANGRWRQRSANGSWRYASAGWADVYNAILDREQQAWEDRNAPPPPPGAGPGFGRGLIGGGMNWVRRGLAAQAAWNANATPGRRFISSAVGAVGGGMFGRQVGGTAGMIGGAIGGGIGGLLGPGGAAVGSVLGTGLGMVTGSVLGVVKSLGVGLVSTVSTIFREIKNHAINLLDVGQRYARDVMSIRNMTGLSVTQSAAMVARFGSLGINAQSLGSMLSATEQDPTIFRQKAAMFGLSGYENKNFLPDIATRYQQMSARGPYGRIEARNMLQTLGMNTPEMMALVNMSPSKIRAQQNWSDQTQAKLGISPGAIKGFAEDFTLLKLRGESFFSMLQVKFGSVLLPIASRFLDKAITWISDNSEKIVSAFITGVRWLYTTMPGLVVGGFSMVIKGASWLAGGLETAARFIASATPAVLGFFDNLINGARELIAVGTGVKAFFTALFNPAAAAQTATQQKRSASAAPTSGGSFIDRAGAGISNWWQGVKGQATNFFAGPNAAYKRAHAEAWKGMEVSNLSGSGKSTSQWLNDRADNLKNLRATLDATAAKVDKFGEEVGREKLERQFDELIRETKAVRAASEKTANNTGPGGAMPTALGRIGSYIAEDAFFGAVG